MHTIRMIATDMDGTLLNKQLEVSSRNAEVIRAAQEKGVLFAVCSGRFCQFGAMKMNGAGISCPVIGANGAAIWDDSLRRIVQTYPIPAEKATEINALLRDYGIYYCVFSSDMITANVEGNTHLKTFWGHPSLTQGFGMRFESDPRYAEEITRSGRALKFFVGKQTDDICERLGRDLKAIEGIYITSSGKNCFEIMNAGVNKCTGVEKLAAMHGIRMDEVMTFGDYFNDMPMIRAAGLGVAMDNAAEEVKACADYVTDTYENDGVAKAIEKFVL